MPPKKLTRKTKRKVQLNVTGLVAVLDELVKNGGLHGAKGGWPKLAGDYDRELSGELLNQKFLLASASDEDKLAAWQQWHQDYFAHRAPQSKVVILGGVFTLPLLLQLNLTQCLFSEATFSGALLNDFHSDGSLGYHHCTFIDSEEKHGLLRFQDMEEGMVGCQFKNIKNKDLYFFGIFSHAMEIRDCLWGVVLAEDSSFSTAEWEDSEMESLYLVCSKADFHPTTLQRCTLRRLKINNLATQQTTFKNNTWEENKIKVRVNIENSDFTGESYAGNNWKNMLITDSSWTGTKQPTPNLFQVTKISGVVTGVERLTEPLKAPQPEKNTF